MRSLGHHHVSRSNAVAVKSEVLVAAIGDQCFGNRRKDFTQPIGVRLHAASKALIGQIDDRQHCSIGQPAGNLIPLRIGIVDPGGVVAAAVQQECVSGRSLSDRKSQRIHVDQTRLGRMNEAFELQPEIGNDLRMVWPTGRAHPDTLHTRALGQCQRNPHRAGAAGGLHTVDPPAKRRIGLAEYPRHQCMDKAHVAFWAKVSLGILRIEQHLFCRLDCAKHWRIALSGPVDADAKIDLGGTRIFVVELDQRKKRVGGLLGKVG